jgi:hypothetical protein
MTAGCRIFGHDYEFRARGATLEWECRRGCGDGGSKVYVRPEAAARYATAFNRRDSDDLGKRAPLLGLLPLRLWRMVKSRSQ